MKLLKWLFRFLKKYNQSIDVIKKDMQTNTKINSLDYKMSWTDKYNYKRILNQIMKSKI